MALSQEDQWTLMFSQIDRSDPGRPLYWARSLQACVDELTASRSESAAALFWIRLFGVVCELQRFFAPQPATPPPPGPLDPIEEQAYAMDEYFEELARGTYEACLALFQAFSADEVLMIQWKRDHEAHPFLDRYELREHKNALKHTDKHKLVGAVAHSDVHVAVARVRGGRDDLSVARDLAQRIVPHVRSVVAALERFPER